MDKKEKCSQYIKCESSKYDSDDEDDLQIIYNKLFKDVLH
jgi:hypothetical protein